MKDMGALLDTRVPTGLDPKRLEWVPLLLSAAAPCGQSLLLAGAWTVGGACLRTPHTSATLQNHLLPHPPHAHACVLLPRCPPPPPRRTQDGRKEQAPDARVHHPAEAGVPAVHHPGAGRGLLGDDGD